ncbi:MAG: transketolase family protein [Candidatus Sungbacteria bacterium]|uniref:Transketolase family protein n=1 Tax=Candidatus Sungiibacteriota bacterium TaxID=2750080 RepID=A0A931YDN5_9BACT|nr:transketolase family protein [Candidatus Sungbacteria bacterium]
MNPNAYLVKDILKPELKPTRDGYGEGLVLAGEKNKDVVVLCADLTESTRSLAFQKKFPERFVEVGVAEQNMASVAAGMALAGKIPFVSSYATFSPGRNNEQIRTTIAYNAANVKIAGAHAGISVGPDGATHQALEDIGLMRMLPGMTVIVPCDYEEAKKATMAAAEIIGPVYLRLGREKTPLMTTNHTPFKIGRAEVFKDGRDVVIFACGSLVHNAVKAALDLGSERISAAVINIHTIKPLDGETILKYISKTKAAVTVEEHQIHGGLGGAVAEFLAGEFPAPIEFIGVDDKFGESGKPDELIEKYGMSVATIKKAVKKILTRK